jgi:probable RNA-binding protein EIF1AD
MDIAVSSWLHITSFDPSKLHKECGGAGTLTAGQNHQKVEIQPRQKARRRSQQTMGRPKRNVLAAAEESLTPPAQLEQSHTLARVIKPEGNNLFTCELPNQKTMVVELGQIFRNTIWIKRGGFVVVDAYSNRAPDSRAEGEIVNVVRDEKQWRKQSYWCVDAKHALGCPASKLICDIVYRPKEFAKVVYEPSDSEEESNVGKMPPSDSEDES